VLVIELLALPARRGPAEEARACYRPLDAGRTKAIAGAQERTHVEPDEAARHEGREAQQ
jgi:hypothetical protein